MATVCCLVTLQKLQVFSGSKNGWPEVLKWKKTWTHFWRKRGWLFDISLLIGVYSAGLIEDAVISFFSEKQNHGLVFDYNFWTRRLPKYDAVTNFFRDVSALSVVSCVRSARGPFFWVKGERILGMAITPGKEEVYSSGNWNLNRVQKPAWFCYLIFDSNWNSILKPLSLNTFPRIYDI